MTELKITVDGMMCGMCEAHLNDLIRREFKIKRVKSSHKSGECLVISCEPLDKDRVADVIESAGYRVVGFIESPYEKKGIFSIFKAKK